MTPGCTHVLDLGTLSTSWDGTELDMSFVCRRCRAPGFATVRVDTSCWPLSGSVVGRSSRAASPETFEQQITRLLASVDDEVET